MDKKDYYSPEGFRETLSEEDKVILDIAFRNGVFTSTLPPQTQSKDDIIEEKNG